MKALVLGVVHRHGTAKGSGREYDFAQIFLLRPIEQVDRGTFNQAGYGFEVNEASLDTKAVVQFQGRKFPCELNLVTDARPDQSGELKLVVTGVMA